MMRVNGPGGITVNFPDNTDHQTIDRVMREAVQMQGANGRIAGAFDAAAPMEGREAPTAYTGALLPISKDIGGHLHPAVPRAVSGIAQSVGDFFSPPANPMGPEGHPTDEAMNWGMNAAMLGSPAGAGAQAGEKIIPGVAQALRREVPKAPTREALSAAGSSGFEQARNMGVDYDPKAMAHFASTARAYLDRQGYSQLNAPNTYDALQRLEQSPGRRSFVQVDDLHAFRRQLQKASDDADRKAGGTIVRALDQFMQNPPASSVMAGPAAAAGAVQKEAIGNWAALERSKEVSGRMASAERRAKASGSGLNLDNTLRGRVATIRDQIDKGTLRGFSKDEIAAMDQFLDGRKKTRWLANYLGGGGGLGASVASGLGGLGAVSMGAPSAVTIPMLAAGVAVPTIGRIAKGAQNTMARTAMTKLDEQIRQRSPLYQHMQANAPVNPISPEMRAAALRAMMLYGASPQNGGGGY